VTITQKWGSADIDAICRAFRAASATAPRIVDADVCREEETREVLSKIRERHERLEAFISNVAFAPVVRGLNDYTYGKS
jgi:hypothetical protein